MVSWQPLDRYDLFRLTGPAVPLGTTPPLSAPRRLHAAVSRATKVCTLMAVRSFFFGFVTAAALAAAGYHYYLQKPDSDPCRVCSTGTKCAAGLCVVAVTPPQPVPKSACSVADPQAGRRPLEAR